MGNHSGMISLRLPIHSSGKVARFSPDDFVNGGSPTSDDGFYLMATYDNRVPCYHW